MGDFEIPTHFLCPISLQLMKDPVTIVTGITYDRDSIEKWFYTCKNTTCPVTKLGLISQPLDDNNHQNLTINSDRFCIKVSPYYPTLMITPNHTLRRLIQSWCTLHASDGVERIPTPKQPIIVNHAYVTKLISDARESTKLTYSCMERILSLVLEGKAKKVLEECGAFDYVGSILIGEGYDKCYKEEALSFFAQIVDIENVFKGLIKSSGDHLLFIDSIVELLRFGSVQIRENGVKVLNFVYKVADPTQLSNVTYDMVREVVNIIRENISNVSTKWALKLLVELNPWGRNRVKVVQAGLVHVLVELLIDGLDRRLSELGLVVLDQLCGCAEGRADLVGHGAGIAVVSKKILRVSHVASDRAVKILSLISRYVATGRVLGDMMEVGVVAKLCLVIQVECSSKTKERAKQMLKLHSSVWKVSPCIPPHLLSSYPCN
ncbi:E3 ubiquitin-protein ligase PUB23-like [Silene latifolia]|uniref:E3 ubiquitin-protein ligase PUB23-like n=1 Tax=Silene latifolia TaxID=37657 RepID=UPI003D7884EF